MKNLIIGMLVVAVVGGGIFITLNKGEESTKSTSSTDSSSSSTSQESDTRQRTSVSPKLVAQTVGEPTDCSLYTLDELATVWGVPMVDTDINKVSELSTDGGKLYTCGYNQTDSGLGVTYTIEYREYPDVDSAKQSISDTRSTEKYGDTVYYTLEEKSGVGDEAFFWTKAVKSGEKNLNQQMYIRKGSTVFLLSGVNLDGVTSDYKDKLLASYKLHFE